MIFDIPASIGSKRKYIVINGVDVDPFVFPNLFTVQYYMTDYRGFLLTRSEIPNVISLKGTIGGYDSDMQKYLQSIVQLKIKDYFNAVGEDIKEYQRLCLVVSVKNDYRGPHYIASSTKINGTSPQQYDVQSIAISQLGDGKKMIYKFNLDRFYELDSMYLRFHHNYIAGAPLPTYLNIHAMYFE